MKRHSILVVGSLALVLGSVLWMGSARPPVGPANSAAVRPGGAGAGRLWALFAPGKKFRPYVRGARRSYQIDARTRLRMGEGLGPSDGALTFGLTGCWREVVLRTDSDAVHLRVSIDEVRPSLAGGGASKPGPEMDALQRDLARSFIVVLDGQGRARGVRFHKDASVFARGLLRALVALQQLTTPPTVQQEWTADEADPSGEYVAEYHMDESGTKLTKRKLRYTRVVMGQEELAGESATALKVAMNGSFLLDAQGLTRELRLRDHLSIAPGAGMLPVDSESELTLKLIEAGDAPPEELVETAPDGEDLMSMSVQEAPEDEHGRHDRQLIGNDSWSTLLAKLRAGGDADEGARIHASLAALFRQDAATAGQAAEAILLHGAAAEAKVLVSALGAAGTEAAQRSLAKVMASAEVDLDVRGNAIAAAGLVADPAPESAQAIRGLLRDRDASLRSTALLALGNVVNGMRTNRPEAADDSFELLRDRLRDATSSEERILCLQALGNTGDARVIELAQPFLRSGIDDERAAATIALRFIEDARVDPILEAVLLHDRGTAVRMAAVFAAGFRQLEGVLSQLQRALPTDRDESVRIAILDLLGRSMAAEPRVRGWIEACASGDPSPQVRAAAQSLLQPRATPTGRR